MKRKEKMLWVQFYSLRDDTGITFRAHDAHVIGGHIRFELPAVGNQPRGWYAVVQNGHGEHILNSHAFTDFSACATLHKHLRRIPDSHVRKMANIEEA
jgi:hypothetical protein